MRITQHYWNRYKVEPITPTSKDKKRQDDVRGNMTGEHSRDKRGSSPCSCLHKKG